MTIGEKVSYIKGLAEGLKVDESTNEGKVITAILDVLGEMAENLAEVDEELDDVADVMTDLEESVSDLEDDVYGYDEDEDEMEDDDFDEDLDEMYETTCPTCFDYDQAAKGEIDCPNCGAALKFSLDDEDDAE